VKSKVQKRYDRLTAAGKGGGGPAAAAAAALNRCDAPTQNEMNAQLRTRLRREGRQWDGERRGAPNIAGWFVLTARYITLALWICKLATA
jgi:hypothetical protein